MNLVAPSKIQQFSINDIDKQQYRERCESAIVMMERRIELAESVKYKKIEAFTVTMNRRIELAALVKNEKIKALTVTLERRRKLVEASILDLKIETHGGSAIIRDWRNELVDYKIERQKYYKEYDNKCTAARKAKTADFVAATATMIANTWTPNDDSNREVKENTFIDTIRNIKENDGLEKDIADTLLRLL